MWPGRNTVVQPTGFARKQPMVLIRFNHEKRGTRERGFADDAAWGQTRYWCIRTKRQQAAALQTLRACHRPLHPPQRVRYHRDQRRDRTRPHGDRHVVCDVRGMSACLVQGYMYLTVSTVRWTASVPRKRGSRAAMGCTAPRAMPRPRLPESRL